MDPLGREKGMLAGANVVMPNLSPPAVRENYALYDGKAATGVEAAAPENPSSGDSGSSDGLGLTDYLLIVLVVLIVVMAIIVAIRLMRS